VGIVKGRRKPPALKTPRPEGTGVPVDESALARYNSYGAPKFVYRGYYVDTPFRCKGCNKEEVWTGAQQKWWYEVAKGYVYSTAKLCRSCRRKEQARRAEARRVHLDGVSRRPRKDA
jgi:putative zinc ribbon protein